MTQKALAFGKNCEKIQKNQNFEMLVFSGSTVYGKPYIVVVVVLVNSSGKMI